MKTKPSERTEALQDEGFDLATMICYAASDYKYGRTKSTFAKEYGGVEALRDELFWLVEQWNEIAIPYRCRQFPPKVSCVLLSPGESIFIPASCPAGMGGLTIFTPNRQSQQDIRRPCRVPCKFQRLEFPARAKD
ncbi:hypothetical protein JYT85_01510 [Desulfocapsa sp. AH-315-G09]|nr:hypothetical protein [Desulfocapsa sp.]MBL4904427.1 hypothetical protein [Desulfocapsa sp.]MBN4045996.1 hypothetical protein [bacterium AH-315-P11]MBN4065304.1 hypothetical protein [Desulfocapsa sp. AH-315-G09]